MKTPTKPNFWGRWWRQAGRRILATASPFFFFFVIPCIDSLAASPSRPKVLIIYSWHDELPWQAGVRAGLHQRLQQAPEAERAEIYEESIDAGRLKDLGFLGHFDSYLRSKYAAVSFDTVISE